MRSIAAIMADWFLRIRAQASFKIMLVVVLLLVGVLFLIKVEDEAIEIAWAFSFSINGLWDLMSVPDPGIPTGGLFFAMLVGLFTDVIPGFAFLVALFATGGVVPDLMQKGRIDLLLGRPVTRFQVVLGNFLGGLLFVALLGLLLVGGSWTAFAVRGHVLDPIYFANIAVILAQYAIVYAVALLLGFLMTSGTAVILLTLAAWGFGKILGGIHDTRAQALERVAEAKEVSALSESLAGPLGLILDVFYWIFPRPAELDRFTDEIFQRIVNEDLSRVLGDIARRQGEEDVFELGDWIPQTASSLGLIVGCLLLATWVLRRRDL